MNDFRDIPEPRISYTAEILIDGEEKGSVFSYTIEGLEEQLRKLKHVEDKFNLGDYDDKR